MATPTFDATHADSFSLAGVANLTSASWTVAGNYLVGGMGSSDSTPTIATDMKWQGSGGTSLVPLHAGTVFGTFAAFRPFSLASPTPGANTAYGTYGVTQGEAGMGMVAYAGVDVAGTPIGTVATATGNNLAPALAVTTAVGDLCVYLLWFFDGGQANRTFTAQSGSQRYTIEGSSLGYDGMLIGDVVAVGTTTNISVTISGANPNDVFWRIYGFALKGSSGTPAASFIPRSRAFDHMLVR